MKKLLRFLKFSLSTLGGTAVDCLVMWLLAEVLFPQVEVVGLFLAPTISFECAVFTNFTLAYFFVWSDRVVQRSTSGYFKRFLPYNISCIAQCIQGMHLPAQFPGLRLRQEASGEADHPQAHCLR